jgi:hypothetical protein
VKLIGEVLSSGEEMGKGRNGCGTKRLGCGAFHWLEEAGRRGVLGERRSAMSGRHSRL